MNSEKVVFEEIGLSSLKARNIIMKLIEDQIRNYNLEHLQAWEANHNVKENANGEKIDFLKKKKQHLEQLFKQAESSDGSVDFSFSLDVKVSNEKNAMAVR